MQKRAYPNMYNAFIMLLRCRIPIFISINIV